MYDFKKIISYSQDDYVLSLSDLIAVKSGIKKITRIECKDDEEYNRLKIGFKKHNLKSVKSDKPLMGKYNIYISKKIEYAIEAKEIDPSYKIINEGKIFTDVIKNVQKFSELISYPECCVKKYIENVNKNIEISKSEIFTKLPNKISFLYNNILNGITNHYLSFHLPCSYECKNTSKYHQKIFNAIEEYSPTYAKEIEGYTRRPYLLFFDLALNSMYVSWDNRKGFVFEGNYSDGVLDYSDSTFFKTNYPDYRHSKPKKDFSSIENFFKDGNKVKFLKDSFIIYYKEKKIHEVKNRESLKYYFLNFI